MVILFHPSPYWEVSQEYSPQHTFLFQPLLMHTSLFFGLFISIPQLSSIPPALGSLLWSACPTWCRLPSSLFSQAPGHTCVVKRITLYCHPLICSHLTLTDCWRTEIIPSLSFYAHIKWSINVPGWINKPMPLKHTLFAEGSTFY